MFKEGLTKLVIITAFIIAIITAIFTYKYLKINDESANIKTTTDVVFISNLSNRSHSTKHILDTLSLVSYDLIVFDGVSAKSIDGLDKLKSMVANNTQISDAAFVSTSDTMRDKSYDSKKINDVLNIFIDSPTGQSCTLNDDQLAFLTDQANTDAPVKILYLYDSIYAGDAFFTEKGYDNASDCDTNYWAETIEPIIEGNIDIVVSGDSEGFKATNKDGIAYVQNGLPEYDSASPDNENLLQFTRIQVSGDGNIVSGVSFGDPITTDTAYLDHLKTYTVITNQDDLLDIYDIAPVYNYDKSWDKKLATKDELPIIQSPIAAKLEVDQQTYLANLSIRGNVGNHWENYKKSWDIQITSTDARQLKFILPSDREYISQLFAEHLNDSLGVLTPHIEVVRLVINDIDMGPYLMYEDFDKAFVELNGFNSDASTSRSLFLETGFWLSVYDNVNFIDKSGNSVDKTYHQKYKFDPEHPETITDYFDQDYTARWIALQIFSGDNHQNSSDNNRFFIDRSTGKYVMVTWDQWYFEFKEDELWDYIPFQQAFYSVPANREIVLDHVQTLIDNQQSQLAYLQNLADTYEDIFINDPMTDRSKNHIAEIDQNIIDTYNSNITLLTEFVQNERNK